MARILCEEIMSKEVVACLATDTVGRAAELMARHHVGALPVIDDAQSRRPLGMLTDRDITLRLVARGRDPKNTTVNDIMSRRLFICSPRDAVEDLIGIMGENQVRRVPVVDDGRLVGIVAQADIASRAGDRQRTAQMLEEISQPAPLE